MKNYNELLKTKVEEIEAMLDLYLPEETGYQKGLISAMNYSLKAGGKRLRALFMYEVFKLCSKREVYQKEVEKLLPPFIVAMEMIHTYSLVHDDLPAMDNDLYRRGKLTTHAKYGEAFGILAGDALLNYAFETAIGAFSEIDTSLPPAFLLYQRVSLALSVLSEKAGIYGMIGGQTVDVEKSGKATDINELNFIYQLKTGALLEASFMIGAILAGSDKNTVKELREIGNMVGMAFQIQDDILDVIGSEEVLGKPVHSDEKNEKTTYLTLLSLEKAKKEVETLSKQAIYKLEQLFETNDMCEEITFLKNLILELITREK